MITSNGIFCIETKNYSGLIFGSEKDEKWTQCLRHDKKSYFYNPLKQNKSHIFHLKKLLDNKYNVYSLIVFTQNNADKIDINNDFLIVSLEALYSFIKSYLLGSISFFL